MTRHADGSSVSVIGLDGIIAKRLDLPYRPGERAMQKYKLWKTVDCVDGGISYKAGTQSIEYLLMGLYGFGDNGQEIAKLLKPLIGA